METKKERSNKELMTKDDYMLDIDLSKSYYDQVNAGIYDEEEEYFGKDADDGGKNIMKKSATRKNKNSQIEMGFRYPTDSEEFKVSRDRTWIAMNVIYRYLNDTPVGIDEIFSAKGKKTKYLAGDGEDFKFAPYGLVHAYLINNIMNPDMWFTFFPKEDETIKKWNENLKKIHDVPSSVLALFEINSFTKRAPVFNYIFAWADFYEFKVAGRGNMKVEAGFEGGWPSKWPKKIEDPEGKKEEVPFEETKKENSQSFNQGTKDKSVKPDNVQDKTGGENDEFQKNNDPKPEEKEHPQDDIVVVADTVKEDINKIVEETPESDQNEEKLDLRAPGKLKFAVLFEPPVFEEKQKEFPEFNINGSSAVNANPPEDQLVEMYGPDGIDDIYVNVNKQWAERFPGLEEFTKLVHKVGLYVNYSTVPTFDTVDVFRADLISKQGVIVKSLLVDYNCIYGDGIRIGTATDKHGSVFNEIWIGLYYKNYVSKLICGTLTEEDVEEVMSKYPAGANIVARMVDFTELPSDIAYPTWKALIARLSKVVINLPSEARFRLVNYKSAYEWVLACAENVDISFISNNDQRLRGLVYPKIREKGLYVQYDENKFKDSNGYIVGYQDGSLVDFNPYEFKSIGKKNQQNDK